MELRGAGIVLRPLRRAGDIDPFVEACNDEEIARFIPTIPVPYARADAEAWIDRCDRVWDSGESHPFLIVDLETGELLGSVELHAAAGSVGYWIAAGARNRGIATRAVRLVLEWWPERPLHLTTHPDNIASQRVAEKAGFRRVGTTPDEPRFRDGTTEAVLFELV